MLLIAPGSFEALTGVHPEMKIFVQDQGMRKK